VKRPLLLLVAMLALVGCPKREEVFCERVAKLRRVAILPPDVHLSRVAFAGDDEPLTAEDEIAARELPIAIEPELGAHGFVGRPLELSASDPADASLRYQVTLAQGRQMTLIERVFSGKPAAGFGPDVGGIADRAEVDALLLVSLVGMTKSGGQVARDVAVTVLTLGSVIYRTSATRLFVTLVHGTTGETLWWSSQLEEALVYEGADLRALVHAAFERMPRLPPAGSDVTGPTAASD